jgi:hypothetical protein
MYCTVLCLLRTGLLIDMLVHFSNSLLFVWIWDLMSFYSYVYSSWIRVVVVIFPVFSFGMLLLMHCEIYDSHDVECEVFYDTAQCSLVEVSQRFRYVYCLHLQGD